MAAESGRASASSPTPISRNVPRAQLLTAVAHHPAATTPAGRGTRAGHATRTVGLPKFTFGPRHVSMVKEALRKSGITPKTLTPPKPQPIKAIAPPKLPKLSAPAGLKTPRQTRGVKMSAPTKIAKERSA